jgi:GUN4-like
VFHLRQFPPFITALILGTIGLNSAGVNSAKVQAIPFKPTVPKAVPAKPTPTATEVVVPAPTVATPMAEPEVKSKPNLDYEHLQAVMKTGDWAEANRLTSLILLTLGDRRDQGYLGVKDTAKLACGELKTVDTLWQYYTGGRSGLTMQARIWRNMSGSTAQDAKKFEGRVGWHKNVLSANPQSAQAGHMPLRPTGDGGGWDALNGGWINAMSDRLETCGIIAKKPIVKPPIAKKSKKALPKTAIRKAKAPTSTKSSN